MANIFFVVTFRILLVGSPWTHLLTGRVCVCFNIGAIFKQAFQSVPQIKKVFNPYFELDKIFLDAYL